MDERDRERLEGLRQLVHDGVEHGARFVEQHHRETSGRVFDAVSRVEPLEAPATLVRTVHDGVLAVSYAGVRLGNRLAGRATRWALARTGRQEDASTNDSTSGNGTPDHTPQRG